MQPSSSTAELRDAVQVLRGRLPKPEMLPATVPVWILEAMTARVRIAEGDRASATEAAARAVALAGQSGVAVERVRCAAAVGRLCADAAIPAGSVAGLREALASVKDIKGAALREHLTKEVSRLAVVAE
jgi:hypothetical protein